MRTYNTMGNNVHLWYECYKVLGKMLMIPLTNLVF